MNKNQVKGKAKEKAGPLPGGRKQDARDVSKKVAGKAQRKVGDVERLIENSQ